jgi:hypothetical protein
MRGSVCTQVAIFARKNAGLVAKYRGIGDRVAMAGDC